MQPNNKYFDVVIKNNSYHIVESSTKPKSSDCAVKTLAKIEKVLKNKMEYDSNRQDAYSSHSKEQLAEILQSKSSQIHTGYTEKQAKIHHVLRRVFSHEKQVAKLHSRIENYITPPSALPLPQDMLNVLGNYLGNSDLSALSQLNRQANTNAQPLIVTRAKEYGYEGIDVDEARRYIKNLFSEVRYLAKHGVIQVADKSLLKDDAFIETLLTPEQMARACNWSFIQPASGRVNFEYIYKYLSKCIREHPEPTSITSSLFNKLGYVASHGDIGAAQFLIDHGANINAKDSNSDTPLMRATIMHTYVFPRSTATLKLLIQKGADVNCKNLQGDTPLIQAARDGSSKVIKILLENGADLTIRSNRGKTAIEEAVSRGNYYSAYLIYKASNKA